MGIVKGRLLFAGALLSLTLLAQAQLPVDLPNVEYNPLLLINASVQRELKMSPQVAANVQNAFMQQALKLAPYAMGGAPQGQRPLTPQQNKAMLYRGIERMQTSLTAMLNPSQRVRLRQLTLQSIGPSAVLQPKVASALALTAPQRSKLESALGAANAKMANDLSNNRTAQTMKARMDQMAVLQAQAKAAGARVLAVNLSSSQRAKWQAMLGKPFKLTGFLGSGNLGQQMMGGR